jgi:maleylacetate reductase
MRTFNYAGHAQEIHFGAGESNRIAELLEPYGWSRLLLCTSGSHLRNGNAARIENALADQIAARVDNVAPHVQSEQVEEALKLALENDVQAIVGLGGGSVIGLAKAVSDRLHQAHTGTFARDASPLTPAIAPTVILPTTYAGSEMTPVYGVTGPVEGVRRKVTVSGRNIVPRVVIYDPELTLGMPAELTGTSAMNALAHCFEAIYSVKRDPLSSAAALRGIRAIGRSVSIACSLPDDLGARSSLLEGAFLAGAALAQVQMAIHHGVCHVLGGTGGVAHGVANTIVLPHALRFNAEVARNELAEAAITLDLARRSDEADTATERVIDWVDRLGDELGLPKSLRTQGVDESLIPSMARIALDGGPVKANPRPVASIEEMEAFFAGLW